MRRLWRIAALLCALSSAAWAQGFGNLGPGPAPGGGGCPLSGCTFTGAVNTSSASGFQIGGLTGLGPGAGGVPALTLGSPNNVGQVYDLASGSTVRQNTIYTQLSASVNTSNIWENNYSSVTLAGPGTANGEINAGHASIIVSAGANSAQAESYEVRLDNSGTMGVYDAVLSTLHNLAGATINQVFGTQYALSNDNATAGSVAAYFAMQCNPLTGAGSEPTTKFCLRNTDPNSGISTLGSMAIGTVAQPSPTVALFIQGADVLGTSFAVSMKALGGANLLSVANDGTLAMRGPVTVGLAGSVVGTIAFANATSGTIKLAPPTGALTPVILTLPDVTDTLATIHTSQTFTQTQTFSGTANFSGVLQGNGVAAVSCTVGTLATATAVITNGIITHC
jgi:hypothetical protein